MSEKPDVGIAVAYRFLHPMHTVLVTCMGEDGKPNIITLAWVMPTSNDPPLVAISVSPKRYSHHLITDSGEFVINIPTVELLEQTIACGTISGRNRDKFKETCLTPVQAKKVKTPVIKECVAHLECRLQELFVTGDHTIFVGKIVAAYANKGIFAEKYDLEKTPLLYHAGGNTFAVLKPKPYKTKHASVVTAGKETNNLNTICNRKMKRQDLQRR
jgi:flavin reductase (DIM6/NTAB) family NADH-FMN oxidoreductase RutF